LHYTHRGWLELPSLWYHIMCTDPKVRHKGSFMIDKEFSNKRLIDEKSSRHMSRLKLPQAHQSVPPSKNNHVLHSCLE
jgi:hypothetical protein